MVTYGLDIYLIVLVMAREIQLDISNNQTLWDINGHQIPIKYSNTICNGRLETYVGESGCSCSAFGNCLWEVDSKFIHRVDGVNCFMYNPVEQRSGNASKNNNIKITCPCKIAQCAVEAQLRDYHPTT